jgi:L-lactate dehydrogenase
MLILPPGNIKHIGRGSDPCPVKEVYKMKKLTLNNRKAAIIGCGFVGSATAFCLMQSGLFSELVLLDVDKEKAEAEALDISHGIPFAGHMKIYAGTYDDIPDAAMIIVTAGAGQKPNETRLDLVHKNVEIFKSIIPEISRRSYQGILLIVSNPVDILTYAAVKLSKMPENRVIGSGTVLDTARLKYELGEHLSVDSRSVHAFIIGEHGDSEIAAWSSANISGVTLNRFCEMRGHFHHDESMDEIAETVKNSAYEIIAKKRATYYGIAMSVKRICEAIVKNEKSVLPVSGMVHGIYGIDGIALSMPVVVGLDGIETHVPISLDKEEQEQLKKSADLLKEIAESLNI